MLLVQMKAPARSESFLLMFGTPALLWRVLHYAEYYEPPLYYWNEVYLEGQPVTTRVFGEAKNTKFLKIFLQCVKHVDARSNKE